MACPAVTQKIITVDGIDTQVCILEFSDRMIINITQKKRIAALVRYMSHYLFLLGCSIS